MICHSAVTWYKVVAGQQGLFCGMNGGFTEEGSFLRSPKKKLPLLVKVQYSVMDKVDMGLTEEGSFLRSQSRGYKST